MSMDQDNNPNQNPYDEYQDPYKDQSAGGNNKKPGRTLLTILMVVGSILLLGIIILVAFVLISRNQTAARFQQQNATINAENTAVSIASETAFAAVQRLTEKALPPTWTPTSAIVATATRTATPVPPTRTPTKAIVADSAAKTQTVAAFLTDVAQNTTATTQATATRRTATTTALPSTGFAEDIGLPGLFGTALALVAIIILTRRLRLSSRE